MKDLMKGAGPIWSLGQEKSCILSPARWQSSVDGTWSMVPFRKARHFLSQHNWGLQVWNLTHLAHGSLNISNIRSQGTLLRQSFKYKSSISLSILPCHAICIYMHFIIFAKTPGYLNKSTLRMETDHYFSLSEKATVIIMTASNTASSG